MARRELQEINAGSMADIAFLLLIFFLVTTTIEIDTGISRKLPPIPPDTEEDIPKINKRNIFSVLINAFNQLQVNGNVMDVDKLKQEAISFIDNNGDASCDYCNGKGVSNKSDNPKKAIISLQNDRGTSYEMYISVQNELVSAYNELRNNLAVFKYGKPFSQLSENNQKEIKKAYPMRISEAEPIDISK